jgi:hypothetical protein
VGYGILILAEPHRREFFMTYASPHLSQAQFMPVHQLMKMHSADALARAGEDTSSHASRMSSIVSAKNAEVDAMAPEPRKSMEGALKGGTIDPIELTTDDKGTPWISNGNKRIARAHQMGIKQLPVHSAAPDDDPLAGWADL